MLKLTDQAMQSKGAMVFFFFFPGGLLLQVPILIVLNEGLWSGCIRWNKSFFLSISFGKGAYQSNRKGN